MHNQPEGTIRALLLLDLAAGLSSSYGGLSSCLLEEEKCEAAASLSLSRTGLSSETLMKHIHIF